MWEELGLGIHLLSGVPEGAVMRSILATRSRQGNRGRPSFSPFAIAGRALPLTNESAVDVTTKSNESITGLEQKAEGGGSVAELKVSLDPKAVATMMAPPFRDAAYFLK